MFSCDARNIATFLKMLGDQRLAPADGCTRIMRHGT